MKPASLRERLRAATKALRSHNFDTLAFRGMSGAFLGPALAARLNKQMILVRKNDGSHSPYLVEGNTNARRYIIVDDFVDSGETMTAITEKVKEFAPSASFLGLLEVSEIKPSALKGKDKRPYPLRVTLY